MRDDKLWVKKIENVLAGSLRNGDLYKSTKRGRWHEIDTIEPCDDAMNYEIIETNEHVVYLNRGAYVYTRRLKNRGQLQLDMLDQRLKADYLGGNDKKAGGVRIVPGKHGLPDRW